MSFKCAPQPPFALNRQGIGTQLVGRMEEMFIEEGMRTVVADTPETNMPARCFLEGLGFGSPVSHVYLRWVGGSLRLFGFGAVGLLRLQTKKEKPLIPLISPRIHTSASTSRPRSRRRLASRAAGAATRERRAHGPRSRSGRWR